MLIDDTELPNVRIITANLPEFRSGAVGAFVNRGSRHETKANNGIAHFLEHMAFKGTETRTCYDISYAIEVDGSYLNAMTSINNTAYYAKGLGENMPTAAEIIGDALTHSKFSNADVRLESGVILQEISQYEDDPGSTMGELLSMTAYPDQPVGRKILGNPDFVSNVKPDDLRDFIQQNYSAETVVVFAAGGIDNDALVATCAKAFKDMPAHIDLPPTVPAIYSGGGLGIDTSKDFSQTSVGILFPSVPLTDAQMYSHLLLSDVLSGGMSSPLFTEVREKRGLVYYVASHAQFDMDFGNFSIFGGMTPDNLAEFIKVACGELAKLQETISEADVKRAKNTRLVQLATVQEVPTGMINYMANSLFTRGYIREFSEIRRDIERVTIDDLKHAAKRLLSSKPSVALVGPVPDADYLGMIAEAIG